LRCWSALPPPQTCHWPARVARWLAGAVATAVALLAGGCSYNAKSLNQQGVAHYLHGNMDAAHSLFAQALSHDPTNPHVYYNLGRVMHHKGLETQDASALHQAEQNYSLCLSRDLNHRECRRALAVLYTDWKQVEPDHDRSAEAFKLLEQWAMQSPNLADPRIELARLYDEFGQVDIAKEKLLEALTVEPQSARALAALGSIREKQGDLRQAMHDYQRSLWYDQNQPEVAARVASLRTALGTVDAPLVPAAPTQMVRPSAPPLLR
jgi:tetratricopeptide (TPR) repeat protein